MKLLSDLFIKINNFLDKTSLSAGDTIIISIVSSLIAVFLAFTLKSFFISLGKSLAYLLIRLCKYIKKKFKQLVILIKTIIMHFKGVLPLNEYKTLERKRLDGKALTNKELKFLEKSKKLYKNTPIFSTEDEIKITNKIKAQLDNAMNNVVHTNIRLPEYDFIKKK